MVYVFVEGEDDELFFERVLPYGENEMHIVRYSGLTKKSVNNYIKSIKNIPGSDYLFFGDADGKSIDHAKELVLNSYKQLSIDKVFIVQYEIESWYYAGLSPKANKELSLKNYCYNTDAITKEDFNNRLPNKTDRKYVLLQILDVFNEQLATKRNSSYCFFSNSGIFL